MGKASCRGAAFEKSKDQKKRSLTRNRFVCWNKLYHSFTKCDFGRSGYSAEDLQKTRALQSSQLSELNFRAGANKGVTNNGMSHAWCVQHDGRTSFFLGGEGRKEATTTALRYFACISLATIRRNLRTNICLFAFSE